MKKSKKLLNDIYFKKYLINLDLIVWDQTHNFQIINQTHYLLCYQTPFKIIINFTKFFSKF